MGDWFGYSVALDGDTLAVGAPREASVATGIDGDQGSNGAMKSGAVYIFQRDDQTWQQVAYVKASNTGADDEFGTSVGLSGEHLVVGANWEDSNATGVDGDGDNDAAADSGAFYIFQ